MNKLTVLIAALTIVNSMTSFATGTSDNQSDPSEIITCPTAIECSRDRSISSCKAVGDNLEYWGEAIQDGPVKKGIYFFFTAQATHQSASGNPTFPLCRYRMVGTNNTLRVNREKSAWRLEATPSTSTNKWVIQGDNASCAETEAGDQDPRLCPFDKVPLIKIESTTNLGSISAYANGVLITKNQPIYSKDGVINMYQAWDGCSDSGQCTIDLMTYHKNIGSIGSVTVDMDNKMEILKVNSDPSTGYEITKPTSDNAIEIKPVKVGG